MNEEFRTRVSLFFIIWPILILVMQTSIYISSMNEVSTLVYMIIVIITLIITVFLLAIATTRYTITSGNMWIRNLFFSKTIRLSEIKDWKICENRICICAASKKQVKIVLQNEEVVYVSPQNVDEFIEILSICH